MGDLKLTGRRISLREQGLGPTVILLHSSSSHSGQWKALIEALSDRFRLIAPDLHGYGRSDPLPQDGQPFFVHDRALVEAIAGHAEGPVHLVGHSLGGAIALRCVAARPELYASLTVIEPVFFSILEEKNDPEVTEYLRISATVMGLVHLGRTREAAREFVDFWVRRGAYDAMDPATRDYVTDTIGRVRDDWAGCVLAVPGQMRLSDLARIAIPTRILCGTETRGSAKAVVRHLREALPDAEYAEVAGAAHMASAHRPELVNPHIIDFLDRVRELGAAKTEKE